VPVLRPFLTLVALCLAAVLGSHAVLAGEPPFPKGESRQMIEGLGCSVLVPESAPPAEGYSLVVALHTHNETARRLIKRFTPHQKRGCIVVAPDWLPDHNQKEQMLAIRRVVDALIEKLAIPIERRHFATREVSFVAMAWLVFDRTPRFATACWLSGARPGGRVPEHARETLSLLVLVGEQSPHVEESFRAHTAYGDKVKSVEVRAQPGVGYELPEALVPYHAWWIKMREGRFEPGDSLAFEWKTWKPGALGVLSSMDAGGFVYWYASASDGADDEARRFQTETLHKGLVQRFGRQLTAWKCDRAEDAAGFAGARLTKTPAVVVFDCRGRVKKTLEGVITADELAAALRSAAKDKTLPE